MINPAAYISFIEADQPINTLTTKFGGNPVWLEKAKWPISKSTGKPMSFICQISIDNGIFPNAKGKMAYIFMTEEDDYIDGTWDPESGENAVIIQPGNIPDVKTKEILVGPTLDSEYSVELKIVNDVTLRELEKMEEEHEAIYEQARDAGELTVRELKKMEEHHETIYEELMDTLTGNKIGGTPLFIQGDEFPEGDDWVLLLQLDAAEVPFYINFGDEGTGYVFINKKCDKAKFLWQCI